MLKLLFLLLLPGLLWAFLAEKNEKECRDNLSRLFINSLLYSYCIFMLDLTVFFLLFKKEYAGLLTFVSRKMQSVEDLSLFALYILIQVLFAYVMAVATRILKYKKIEKAFFTMTVLQRNCATGILVLSLAGALFTFAVKDNAEHSLVINEVCSKNDTVIADSNGNHPDYIEIYNPSKWSISLKGFHLSDRDDLKVSIELEDVVIPAKGYYIVWMEAEDKASSFGISSKGENVYLANPGGKIIDMVTIPELERNVSFARATDGSNEWVEELPSPLAKNDALKKHLDDPVFSEESGFYEEEFLLSIKAGEGERVYYTLDCSLPDENSNLYTDKILVKNLCNEPNVYIIKRNVVQDWDNYNPTYGLVDKAFIVRAVAVDDLGNTSDVVTKIYLVDMEEYKDKFVLSLVPEPEDLFGDNGIYVTGWEYDEWYAGDRGPANILVNFLKKGREYEIDCSLTLLNNSVLMEQEVGLRIQGGSTRLNPIKRFSIYARKEYSGSRYFEYDLFGKNTHSMFTRGDFTDSFVHSLVVDRNVGTQKAVPASVFLVGEFWYDTDLREKYSEDYLAEEYNVPSDKVQILEYVPEDLTTFLETHDLSKDEDYGQFCEMVDVQSYIDYTAINIYACNMDYSEKKNYKVWRTTEKTDNAYGDGKIRWLLYDLDCMGWYTASSYKTDSFSQQGQHVEVAINQQSIYKALRTNKDFCRRFVLTFMDIVNHNFAYDTVAEKFAERGYDMSWNYGFYENRFDVIVPALAREFDLKGTLENITLSVNDEAAGYVQINTITPKLTNGNWTGSYYTDYPVTIKAIANDGYKFVGWRCGEEMITDTQIEVQLEVGGCQWEAVFE